MSSNRQQTISSDNKKKKNKHFNLSEIIFINIGQQKGKLD